MTEYVARLERCLDEALENAAGALELSAAAHARERRLIRMVEDRDRLICELQGRVGGLAGWEGTD